MDPVSALGVVVNTIQLIDCATKIIGEAYEIYKSADQDLPEHVELKSLTRSLSETTICVEKSIKERKGNQIPLTHNELEQIKLGESCRAVASEILEALEKLKAKGKHSKWSSVRQALKTVMKQGALEKLEKRLDRFRQELIVNTLAGLRQEMKVSIRLQTSTESHYSGLKSEYQSIGEIFLKHITESRRWRDDLLDELQKQPAQLNAFPDAERLFDRLSKSLRTYRLKYPLAQYSCVELGGRLNFPPSIQIDADARPFLQRVSQNVLSRLGFAEIPERQERIAPAHAETFEWIFRGSGIAHGHAIGFVPWLRSKEDIYWITGKPGSGKSTLMKFISNDERTKRHLGTEQSETPLTLVAFYFWNSGTDIQMSQEGLFRSLLFDILRQNFALLPHLFPERYHRCCLFGDDRSPFRLPELLRALRSLSELKDERFCFLIDGLDEFGGSLNGLIELVMEMAAFPNVRICAASRPWPVFEDAFGGKPSLRVQDLNTKDIRLFATCKLCGSQAFQELAEEEPEYAESLLWKITGRSEGVFLWVRLVVMSLLRGLTNGDRILDLDRRLDELPPDLEHLFQKMLDSMEPNYRKHASEIFQLHRAACTPFTLLSMSFADQEDLSQSVRLPIQPLTERTIAIRCNRMKRRVMSRCMGLLEAETCDEKFEGSNNLKIEYLHRTVKDFLNSGDIWTQILKETGQDFDPNVRLCASSIMQMKIMTKSSASIDVLWDLATSCLEYAGQSRVEHSHACFPLLEELDRAATLQFRSFQMYETVPGMTYYTHWTTTKFPWSTPVPFIHLVAAIGLDRYLEAKIVQNPELLVHDNRFTPLSYSTTCSGVFRSYSHKPFCARPLPSVEVLRLLISKGADRSELYRAIQYQMIAKELPKDLRSADSKYLKQWQEVISLITPGYNGFGVDDQPAMIFSKDLSHARSDLAGSKELASSSLDADGNEDLNSASSFLSPSAVADSVFSTLNNQGNSHRVKEGRVEHSETRTLELISRFNTTIQWVFALDDCLETPIDWENVVSKQMQTVDPFFDNISQRSQVIQGEMIKRRYSEPNLAIFNRRTGIR